MIKLALIMSLIAMVVIPLRAARTDNPKKGLKRAVYGTLLFNLVWATLVVGGFLFFLRNPQVLFPDRVQP
jgi:hypothetical protein